LSRNFIARQKSPYATVYVATATNHINRQRFCAIVPFYEPPKCANFLPHASKVLFESRLRLLFVCFCLCLKYLENHWTDLREIHRLDVFGPSLGRFWMSRSNVKGQGHQGQKAVSALPSPPSSGKMVPSAACCALQCIVDGALRAVCVWKNIFSSSFFYFLSS